MLNILLIDDHALFRQGLKFLLTDLESDLLFTEADSCDQATSFDNCDNFDLLLLDYHVPGQLSGIFALTAIKQHFEKATVVIVSGEEDPDIIRSAIEHGAGGYIPKSTTPEVLIAALKLVLAGGIYLPAASMHVGTVESSPSKDANTNISDIIQQLSDRQRETLFGALKGKPNKVIARELNIAEGTVKAHLSVAFRALGARNRTEAVYLAAQAGFTP